MYRGRKISKNLKEMLVETLSEDIEDMLSHNAVYTQRPVEKIPAGLFAKRMRKNTEKACFLPFS